MKTMYEKEVFLVIFLTILDSSFGVNRPPSMFIQALKDVYYKPGETVQMPCVANGIPRPTYRWKRNGIDYNRSRLDDRVVQLPNAGTIVISRPEDKDEAIFQCFADNGYGVSASIKVNLREAKLAPFAQKDSQYPQVQVSDSLTLQCVPPMSVPAASNSINWVLKEPDGQLTTINYDKRVTMDLEGSLRFTNVIFADEQGGKAYVCMAINTVLRQNEMGPEHIISVYGLPEDEQQAHAVQELWSSPADQLTLIGNTLVLKCIFSGNPTPDVKWKKFGGTLSQNNTNGQELEITDVQKSDEGTYECEGQNSETIMRVKKLFKVKVEAAPYWTDEPIDAEKEVGEAATFICLAVGDPSPDYQWFINGIQINDSTDTRVIGNTRTVMETNNFTLIDLTLADHMNIQCNASNKYGYVFADVFLNVLDGGPISGCQMTINSVGVDLIILLITARLLQ